MVNDILKVKVHGGSHTSLVTNGLIKLMSFLRINISKDNMAIHYRYLHQELKLITFPQPVRSLEQP